MTDLQVSLSQQPAPAPWQANALLSFNANKASIHLPEVEPLRAIRKAARLLEGLSAHAYQLVGDWHNEQQWAFACAATSAKRQGHIQWCDNADQQMLSQRYAAHCFACDLTNQSPQQCSPESLAEQSLNWLRSLAPEAISSRMLVGDALAEAGWVGVYEVGRGSDRPPVMLQVDFNPSGDANAPTAAALVGKGITFDSGGYSIKPSESMLYMKCDMGGAATVAAALGLAMMQGLNKRVQLFLCCAENLISGHAYKLGDILTYKNGVTVEVVNTDAEGRLVLADGLLAAGETGTNTIINAATLTGAAHVAVGPEYNALFCRDTASQTRFLTYAEQENEATWPLPLDTWHQDQCPSPYADTANSRPQKGGGAGGASNAAGFLSRFVPQEVSWAHFDIAAAFNSQSTATHAAGATGQGVRTIARALLAL